jgi:hypothetical protein
VQACKIVALLGRFFLEVHTSFGFYDLWGVELYKVGSFSSSSSPSTNEAIMWLYGLDPTQSTPIHETKELCSSQTKHHLSFLSPKNDKKLHKLNFITTLSLGLSYSTLALMRW